MIINSLVFYLMLCQTSSMHCICYGTLLWKESQAGRHPLGVDSVGGTVELMELLCLSHM